MTEDFTFESFIDFMEKHDGRLEFRSLKEPEGKKLHLSFPTGDPKKRIEGELMLDLEQLRDARFPLAAYSIHKLVRKMLIEFPDVFKREP